MSGKRITPAEVLAAYRATGLRPVRRDFGDDKRNCGCPVHALWAAAGHPLPSGGVPYAGGWADDQYGSPYTNGFICGVDSDMRTIEGERAEQGRTDGAAVWSAVVVAGLTEETK